MTQHNYEAYGAKISSTLRDGRWIYAIRGVKECIEMYYDHLKREHPGSPWDLRIDQKLGDMWVVSHWDRI